MYIHKVLFFDWDDSNREHIARHDVEKDEVEEAFAEKHCLFKARAERTILLGRSGTGRYLFVVFERIAAAWIRVVTARTMTSTEQRLYRRKL